MLSVFVLAVALSVASPAPAQRIVKEGPVEKMIVVDGESAAGWSVAEATVTSSAEHARSGRAILFDVPVDWHAGEKKYPIGWPRCWLTFAKPQDWSKWDRMSFWIYTDFNRDTLPNPPLGLIVLTKDFGNWQRSLDTLAKGKWVHFVFPLASIPGRDKVTGIKFFISEAYYRDGDRVRFWIDDFELVRYVEPTVAEIEPLAHVCYVDEPAMPMEIEVLGVPEGQKAEVILRLEESGRAVLTSTRRLPRGRWRVTLRLPKGLKPGMYRLVAATEKSSLSVPIRLVESPWR